MHHRKWLRHSNGNTALGDELWDICREVGLKQLVREPTRGDYLLDLVLSDVQELVSVRVLPELSDHRMVSIDLDVVVPAFQTVPRLVWDTKFANWDDLRRDISATNWASLLSADSVDDSVAKLCERLDELCSEHIPRKTVSTRSGGTHPWRTSLASRPSRRSAQLQVRSIFAIRSGNARRF